MKYLTLLIVIIFTICCTKESFDQRSWTIGEKGMQENTKFTSDGNYDLKLTMKSEGFCVGGYNLAVKIEVDGESVYNNEVSQLAEIINFSISESQEVIIDTQVVTGDPQINCFRLGNVVFTLEEE
ncbi:MAG: hypothetical protein HKN68_18115 [Saprospiraceae bacterium]|nr:hypothetical protein [Saprospiraceae bacterium]